MKLTTPFKAVGFALKAMSVLVLGGVVVVCVWILAAVALMPIG